MLGLNLTLGVAMPGQQSLLSRALSAIRRNGGTLIGIPDNFAGAYIDSTGTPPVTAIGDPVGLLTDRSYGAGNLGVELAPAISLTAWAASGTDGTHIVTVSNGTVRYQSGTTSPQLVFSTTAPRVTPGKTYLVTVVCSAWTSGSVKVFENSTGRLYGVGSVGTFSGIITADQAYIGLTRETTNVDLTISSISVREVLGNHATQPTTASKPVVTRVPKRLGANLVSNGTFDASLSGWTNPDTAPSVTEWVAGRARMTAAAGGSLARLRQQVPVVAGKTYQTSVSAVTITGTPGAALALGNASSGDTTYGNIPLSTAGRFAREVTPTGSIIGFAFTAGNATGGSITLDDVEVREVLEWTNAISFDGSNDFLQTGITTGNEGWICVGVTFSGGAGALETVTYAGGGGNTVKGAWLARAGSVGENLLWCAVSDGVTRDIAEVSSVALRNVPHVVSGGWTAISVIASVDNTEVTTARTNGTAAPGIVPMAIGGVSGAFATGPMTAIIYTQVLPNALDRALIRKWVGSLQGQTL